MSFLTEKKANDLFEAYKKAELLSDPKRTEATRLELELNDGGWFIVGIPGGGTTIKKKEGDFNIPVLEGSYFPRETTKQPYQGGTQASYSTLWISIGIIVCLTVITIVVIHFTKKSNADVTSTINTRVEGL